MGRDCSFVDERKPEISCGRHPLRTTDDIVECNHLTKKVEQDEAIGPLGRKGICIEGLLLREEESSQAFGNRYPHV